MNRGAPPTLPDWVVLTVRWIFVIGVSFWLAFGERMQWGVLWLVILAGVGNIIATFFVVSNRVTRPYRFFYTLADFIFAHALFYLSAGSGRELTWVGILPLISASMYFQWLGMLVVALLNLALQAGIAYQVAPLEQVILLAGIMLPVYLIVGLAAAYGGVRLHLGFHWQTRRKAKPRSEAERKALEKNRTIFDLISALSANLNYQKVLETSLDLSAAALAELDAPTERLVSAVMLFTNRDPKYPEMSVATSRRFLPTDRNVTLPGTSGALKTVIEQGNTVLIQNPKDDPELGHVIALHACKSAYALPLRTGLDAYGVMLFAHPEANYFAPERSEILEVVCNQAVVAIQNARLYLALEQEKNRMMEIQEDSRKKLARDLHDGPTQSISAIAMRVNFARRLMEKDLKSASEELFKIEELARRTTKEIRHMLFTLRPLVLESQGLVVALESMAEKVKETYNQDVIVQADGRVAENMEVNKQAVVFYLAEEAITNARKHAQAAHIWVRLKMMRDGLSVLEIEDDGVGFDTSAVGTSYESRGSLGMINLRERTELVNGVLRIDSAKGKGTRVQVIIPLSEEAADRLRRGS